MFYDRNIYIKPGILPLYRNKFLYIPPDRVIGSVAIFEIVVADTEEEAMKKIEEQKTTRKYV